MKRATVTVVTLTLLTNVVSCRDNPSAPDGGTPSVFVVSEPVTQLGSALAGVSGTTAASASVGNAVYVSVPSGAFPGATLAEVAHRTSGFSVTRPMVDGGLDPVAVVAGVGDQLSIAIRDSSGVIGQTSNETAPASRRPTVVRTIPPRGKTDVPLNARITVVFSEPMNVATLASIRLLRDSAPVPGSVVSSVDGLRAEFRPATLLAANTTYVLFVPIGVLDLQSSAPERAVEVPFTTGSTVALASIVTDEPALVVVPGNGQVRTFEMNAILSAEGQFSGQFSIFYADKGWRVTGRVNCFAIVEGKSAWVAGVIETASHLTNTVGVEEGWRLADNGAPHLGESDQLSLAVDLNDDGGTAKDFCAATPLVDPLDGELELQGLVSGNIVVRGTTPVMPLPRSLRVAPDTIRMLPGAKYPLAATYNGRQVVDSEYIDVDWALADATGGIAVTPLGKRRGVVTITSDGTSGAATTTVVARIANRFADTTVVLVTERASFSSVSAGVTVTCALTNAGSPYCESGNARGELGDGGQCRIPECVANYSGFVGVAGGYTFTSISSGGSYSCGMTSAAAYCWGDIMLAGASSVLPIAFTPTRVADGMVFRSLSTGEGHTCALTQSDEAYCWGDNYRGQFGDGTRENQSATPRRFGGDRKFTSISAYHHTCALTADGSAYCAGASGFGQLGNGQTREIDPKQMPAAVIGGLSFAQISAGDRFTCAITKSGAPYCWGANRSEPGGPDKRAEPTAIKLPEGAALTEIASGYTGACGRTSVGVVYCWGLANVDGDILPPTRVPGNLQFTSLTVGNLRACGMARDAAAYCWSFPALQPKKLAGQR
jgi:hypothetical protein